MPVLPTYPGIYIEEIPSGVRPIVGVSTSDTAFIDFFARGPVNEATRITSLGDFERTFGGLDKRSEASYGIQQFYLNGGQVAWVVRISGPGMQTASTTLTGGSPLQDTLIVNASSPGEWASEPTHRVEVAVDYNTAPPHSPTNESFNLFVREINIVNDKTQVIAAETHRNLILDKTSPRFAINVVNAASALVRLKDASLGHAPNPSAVDAHNNLVFTPLTNGSDGNLMDSQGNVNPGEDTAFGDALIGSDTITVSPDDGVPRKSGLFALGMIAPFIFNILCLPATTKLNRDTRKSVLSTAQAFCLDKRAFLIVDLPASIATLDQMTNTSTGYVRVVDDDGLRHPNAATYFPLIEIPDRLDENRPRRVGASGTLAGVYSRTDADRGVWKAPAGTDADLRRASLVVRLADLDNAALNPLGINVLRNFPIFGNVSWGARTLEGADQAASEWKYIPVRRMALFIEESLYQGLKWVVFEPNDEPLWAQIRLNVGAFMQNLFQEGAFQGQSRQEAYFVKCDRETTTQNDVDLGIVNVVVGFAPLKPAEFVILQIQQMAGQVQT